VCGHGEEEAGGRRRRRRQAGVHNQKQEPHTKMWGKTSVGRNHGSRSELPGEGVRIPREGHYFRGPDLGSNEHMCC